jgi:hypothetical protein
MDEQNKAEAPKPQSAPTLSPEEIYNITHYRRPAEQLRALAQLGIPAVRRHDNTICVLRAHVNNPPTTDNRPRLRL